jgi:hypothetical protein
MKILGSRADTAQLRTNENRDWDFLCTQAELELWKHTYRDLIVFEKQLSPNLYKYLVKKDNQRDVVEFEIIQDNSPSEELWHSHCDLQTQLPIWWKKSRSPAVGCPSRQQLAQVKRAHCTSEHHFHKHIRDYHALRNRDEPWDSDWVKRRAEQVKTLKAAIDKKISLKKNSSSFFGQSASKIKPLFVHDELHRVIAEPKAPAYSLFQTQEVYCDRNMFDALPLEERIRAVVEESQVLAVERILAPFYLQGNWFNLHERYANPQFAFEWGLMRVCTTITSGWFRTFAIEHWPQAMAMNDNTYWDKVLSQQNSIPLYEDGVYAHIPVNQ